MRFQSIGSVVFPSNSPLLAPTQLTPSSPGPLIINNIPTYEPYLILDIVVWDHFWGLYIAVDGGTTQITYGTFDISQAPGVVTQVVVFISDPRDTSVMVFWSSAANIQISAQSSASNPGIINPNYATKFDVVQANAGASAYVINPLTTNATIAIHKLSITWANLVAAGQVDVIGVDGKIASILQNTGGGQVDMDFLPQPIVVFIGTFGLQVANNGSGGVYHVQVYWHWKVF